MEGDRSPPLPLPQGPCEWGSWVTMGLNLSGKLGTLGNVSESRVWLIPQGSWRGLPTVTGELAGWCLVPPPPTHSPRNKNALTEHSWTGPLALSGSSGEPVWSPGSTGNRCRPDAGLSRAPCRLSTQGLDQPLLSDLVQSCSVQGGGQPLL